MAEDFILVITVLSICVLGLLGLAVYLYFKNEELKQKISKNGNGGAREDFVSTVVHELRSPLESIRRAVWLARSGSIKKSESNKYLEMVYKDSSELLSLINNLLDIAKIEAGKFEIKKEAFSIKELIEGRIDFFEPLAKNAKIKLSAFFDPQLPESAEFDPHAISQVLNNLISNAIKFSKEKGAVQVQALFCPKGLDAGKKAKEQKIKWFLGDLNPVLASSPDCVIVAVTDKGVGIRNGETKNLFNNFSQVKNIFVEKDGTGLGLSVSKNIIESHGGKIGVESVEGQGSTFYFVLPLK